ncbi:hypothetical protein ACIPW9_20760 [Streptomyces sp. NPDC090052]|uniref:hypothetical protein n=1 Tax=unclassified Streptomyces TaxID=2593676 RepID=UPI002B1D30C3|nr:hypothetical protein [Streptomyces sp. NBC_01306]
MDRLGEFVGTGAQFVTIAAVLLGALTTHVTNSLMERRRMKYQLMTRWDDKKLDAYDGYVDRVRACIFLAVQLYETTEGLREREQTDAEILAEMKEAGRLRGRAFERVMLLGGDDVIEAAHDLSSASVKIDWQANGKVTGTLEEWRDLHRAVFRSINAFHEAARADLGVSGNVTGEQHPHRDLLLPPPRTDA